MKGAITSVCLLVMIAFMSGCTNQGSGQPVEAVDVGTDTGTTAADCQNPPRTLSWGKKTYTLKTISDYDL